MKRLVSYTPVLAGLLFASASIQAATVTLATSPNPSNYGQAVTLTATLSPAATGKVTFYDGVDILGSADVNGTTAVLSTITLRSGVRSLRAFHTGDANNAPAGSPAVSHTVVTAPSLGFRAVVAAPNLLTGAPGNAYTADFNNDSKLDILAVEYSRIGILRGNGDGTFLPAAYTSLGTYSGGNVVTADFNRDGKLDVAIANSSGLAYLPGNGDGTFQTAVSISTGTALYNPVTGDFNQDGRPDLLVTTAGGTADLRIRLLLSNGDGTFLPAQTLPGTTTTNYFNVSVADFNADGAADILSLTNSGTAALFLGNGNGTFQDPATFGTSIDQIVTDTADINNDGRQDIVFVDSPYLYFLAGNGNGTFQSAAQIGTGFQSGRIALQDVNGDGRTDLIYYVYEGYPTYASRPSVTLSTGGGGFEAPVGYSLSNTGSLLPFAMGDFTGDGTVDLVALSSGQSSVQLLRGGGLIDLVPTISAGSGFTQNQSGAAYQVTVRNAGEVASRGSVGVVVTVPAGMTGTSISGSGWTCNSGTLACTRSESLAPNQSYAPITVQLNVGGGTGSVTGTATVSGGGDGVPGNNSASATTNIRFQSTVSLAVSPNPATAGGTVTLVASAGTATGRIAFYDGPNLLGWAALAGGQATYSTTLLPSGVRSLTARYSGDASFGPGVSPVRVLVVNPVPANGAGPGSTVTLPSTSRKGVTGDFNRDGKVDLALVGSTAVNVLLGRGNGTFQDPASYTHTSGQSWEPIAAGDLDQDGFLDLVAAFNSYSTPSIRLFRGNGDGTFNNQNPPTVAYSTFSFTPRAVSITDVTGDGAADVIVRGAYYLFVLPGNGDGTFRTPLQTAGLGGGQSHFEDVNGDGRLDLLSVESNYNGRFYWALGNGDGTFQSPSFLTLTGNTPILFATGDYDSDGFPDGMVYTYGGFVLLKGKGDGTFNALTVPLVNSLSYVRENTAFAGDFNGDGNLDFAYDSYYSPAGWIGILFGNGSGGFDRSVAFVGSSAGQSGGSLIADFNSDGRLDFALLADNQGLMEIVPGGQFSGLSLGVTHTGNFAAGGTGSYKINVSNRLFQPPAGQVSVAVALPSGFTASSLSGTGWTCTLSTLTCVRNDSVPSSKAYPDIVLAVDLAQSMQPSTLSAQVSGSLGGVTNTVSDPVAIRSGSSTSLTVTPAAPALSEVLTLSAVVSGTGSPTGNVAFFDGDRPLGVAVLNAGSATLQVKAPSAGVRSFTAAFTGSSAHGPSLSAPRSVTVTSRQASGFGQAALWPAGAVPELPLAVHLNNDSHVDLITLSPSANASSVLLGNGDGTFQTRSVISGQLSPGNILVSDLNSDGKRDLVVGDTSRNEIRTLLGQGDGTFQSIPPVSGITPSTIVSSDYNGDGYPDLAVLSNSSLYLLTGMGDGRFSSPEPLFPATTSSVYQLAGGDFNGDGKGDILQVLYSDARVYLGRGDGRFHPSVTVPVLSSSWVLRAGDLNGDGRLDLFHWESNGVRIYLGKGDGTFQNSMIVSLPYTPAGHDIGDINGDGKPDLVITDGNSRSSFAVLPGKGDGTFFPPIFYLAPNYPMGVAITDLNGDGRSDMIVANRDSSNVTVFQGLIAAVLSATSEHTGNFLLGQGGFTYTLRVANLGPGTAPGPFTLTNLLPQGLTATAMSGSGWICTLSTLTCTQNGTLVTGASLPPITLTVSAAANAPASVVNTVSVSAPGSISGTSMDATDITALPPPVLVVPASGQTGVALTPTLTWLAAAGAQSYDVYFGTQASPPLVLNTTALTYTPAAALAPATVYYWKVVAKNANGSATSNTLSFFTRANTTIQPMKVGAFGGGGYFVQDRNGNFAWDGNNGDAVLSWTTGQAGEVPVFGDWNGDGKTEIGMYVNGTWRLDYNGNGIWEGAAIDRLIFFGGPGFTPVVGDWNGTGWSKIGVHQNGTWMIDHNGNFAWDGLNGDRLVFFGGAGYAPLVGDWNGSGTTKIAVHQNGTWLIDFNGNFAWDGPAVDKLLFFGGAGYEPMVGDWNGSGSTKIGAHKDGTWLLDHNGSFTWDGIVADRLIFFGGPGYIPVVGDWDGSGSSKVAAYKDGLWVLDFNGSFTWDPPVDRVAFFGGPGQTPVWGRW